MLVKLCGRKGIAKPKVGVALSGGGIRGIAHIGVLQVLVDRNIPIHMISGTSAGAIIASLFACGYTPQQMESIIANLEATELVDLKVTVSDLFKHSVKSISKGMFRFWSVLPTGLIKGDKIERLFTTLWQDYTVRDTVIPLAVTAVDINTADTIFFTTPVPGSRDILNARYYHNTLISDAVRASISIPGVFYPKKYRGMTLVDGAVKNNLPTDILKHMGADVVIAVDLAYAGQPNYQLNTVTEILIQCIDVMSREVTLLKGEQYADVIIRPNLDDINYKSFKQAYKSIARGAKATMDSLEKITKLLS